MESSFWSHFGFILESFWTCCGVILDLLWSHFGLVVDSFWSHFGLVVDSFWTCCGVIMDLFWIHFGLVVESFWTCFGVILDFWTTKISTETPKLTPKYAENPENAQLHIRPSKLSEHPQTWKGVVARRKPKTSSRRAISKYDFTLRALRHSLSLSTTILKNLKNLKTRGELKLQAFSLSIPPTPPPLPQMG